MNRRAALAAPLVIAASTKVSAAGAQVAIYLPDIFPDVDAIGADWKRIDEVVVPLGESDQPIDQAWHVLYGGPSGARIRVAFYRFNADEQTMNRGWDRVMESVDSDLPELLYHDDRRAELAALPAPDGVVSALRIESIWQRYMKLPVLLGYYLFDAGVCIAVRVEGGIGDLSDYRATDRFAQLVRARISEN